ncbi:MAG: helix-turn-helix transcriptional regulator [Gemmatimonadaceae bacterium]|nr:helix-turn-helix transcriptional regulator [Gemmatimonadaceae bacterium]
MPGHTVRQILRDQGRSVKWLARVVGEPEKMVSHWLNHRIYRHPPEDFWRRCALVLGVPLDLILSDDQPHDTKRSA